jgi:hypothetical protein
MSDAAVAEAGTEMGTGVQEPKKYLIIGCGPAALIAARTLEQNGVDTDHLRIVSKEKEPSEIGGAQFLHRPVLGETEPDGMLSVVKIGTGMGYAEKVYGDGSVGTSFDRLALEPAEEIQAWSLQKAYSQLWEDYEPGIEVMHVDSECMDELLQGGEYDEIICTIPPDAYCSDPTHVFESVPILLGISPMDELPFDNTILYSGRLDDVWYRLSSIFGEQSIEYGSEGGALDYDQMKKQAEKLFFDKTVRGIKPTKTTCDCGFNHPDTKLLRVGRFGMWDRRRLLHQVPAQVAEVL